MRNILLTLTYSVNWFTFAIGFGYIFTTRIVKFLKTIFQAKNVLNLGQVDNLLDQYFYTGSYIRFGYC